MFGKRRSCGVGQDFDAILQSPTEFVHESTHLWRRAQGSCRLTRRGSRESFRQGGNGARRATSPASVKCIQVRVWIGDGHGAAISNGAGLAPVMEDIAPADNSDSFAAVRVDAPQAQG